jgi:hypothetical protein
VASYNILCILCVERPEVLATRTDDMAAALTAFGEKRSPTYLGH